METDPSEKSSLDPFFVGDKACFVPFLRTRSKSKDLSLRTCLSPRRGIAASRCRWQSKRSRNSRSGRKNGASECANIFSYPRKAERCREATERGRPTDVFPWRRALLGVVLREGRRAMLGATGAYSAGRRGAHGRAPTTRGMERRRSLPPLCKGRCRPPIPREADDGGVVRLVSARIGGRGKPLPYGHETGRRRGSAGGDRPCGGASAACKDGGILVYFSCKG